MDDICSDYKALCDPPEDANVKWLRKRGFDLEKLLFRLLDRDKLEPSSSYKTSGEQIDGSFFLDGIVILLEAKWQQGEIPASTLYQFKGKVDGKLVGTLGVFISMSGYSQDAVDALTLGKSLNVILFDKRDIDAAIHHRLGFKEVLKRKLRRAAEYGTVYFPTEVDVVTSDDESTVLIERLGFDTATGSVFSQESPTTAESDLIIICEGSSDREVIGCLASRILVKSGSKKRIKIVVAMGKFSVPKVANAIHNIGGSASNMLIVIDGDGDLVRSHELLERGIEFSGWKEAIPDPAIEVWLGLDRKFAQRHGTTEMIRLFVEAAQSIDIEALREQDDSFAAFYDAVLTS